MTISTHVLDAGLGRPIGMLEVELERRTDRDDPDGPGGTRHGRWQVVAGGHTDGDGRIADLFDPDEAGWFRLTFHVGGEFYPEIVITFRVTDPAQHYHVPLLFSGHAYTTYRGS